LRLCALHVAARDDDRLRRNSERLERRVDLGPSPRRRDAVGHLELAKLPQDLDRARQRSAFWQQLAIELTVPLLNGLRLIGLEGPPDLTRDRAREQASAHPDAAMDTPAVDRHPGLRERTLPGEHVHVDG